MDWEEILSAIGEHIDLDCDPNNHDYAWMRKGLIIADDEEGQMLPFVKEHLKYDALKADGKVMEITIDDEWPLDSLNQCWNRLYGAANKVQNGLLIIHICDVKIFSHCWCLMQLAKQESDQLKFKGYVLLSIEGIPWSFAEELANEDNPGKLEAMMQFFYIIKNRQNGWRDFRHVKEMVNVKFPMYEVIKDPDGFKLIDKTKGSATTSPVGVSHEIMNMTTADSLIRVDYSYLKHFIIRKAAPASHFDMAALMMASTGNVSLLSLIDRIPVYVVDSKFMEEHFDREDMNFDDDLFRCMKHLSVILDLLEQMLLVFKGETPRDAIYKIVEDIKNHLEELDWLIRRGKLLEHAPWLRVVQKIKSFIDEIQKWGLDRSIDNSNFQAMLERLISDLKDILQTYYRMPQVEYLGVYCPEWEKQSPDGKEHRHEKAIFICWERIHDCAEKGRAVDLLTKVTIHEFCHAYMDIITRVGGGSEDVYHWMEESMANVMTLAITDKYVIKHPSKLPMLNYFKEFMSRQPDAYASAVAMWENGICDYDLWAWNKEKCLNASSVQKWCKEMELCFRRITPQDIRGLWNDVRKEIMSM